MKRNLEVEVVLHGSIELVSDVGDVLAPDVLLDGLLLGDEVLVNEADLVDAIVVLLAHLEHAYDRKWVKT